MTDINYAEMTNDGLRLINQTEEFTEFTNANASEFGNLIGGILIIISIVASLLIIVLAGKWLAKKLGELM
jgi:hypothetical protein